MTLNQLDVLAFERLDAAAGLAGWHLEAATLLAEWLVYLVPIALVALWLSGSGAARVAAVRAAITGATALLFNQAIGLVWDRPRPLVLGLGHAFLKHAADASFPSDHVTILAATGIALWIASSRAVRNVGITLTAAALVAGWARVFLGIHYPGDALGALAIAALIGAAFGTAPGQSGCARLTLRLEDAYRRLLARAIARGWLRA
ncbi:MAG: phosphatase PAP2 family protein [Betaproteobacteria bacterium]|nr:phosphatase PAP2 family protein [Betaproteobacteria bacterium]